MPRFRTPPAFASLGAPAWLGGCGGGAASGEAAPLLAAALGVLACAACFAAGWLGARLRCERVWRDQREELLRSAEVLPGWSWRTDASHRWVHRGAPEPRGSGLEQLARHPQFIAALAQERVFRDLRLTIEEQRWRLDGAPLFDAAGRLRGHVGHALPLPGHASPAGLEAFAGPALCVNRRGPHWQVVAHNEAAQLLWPGLEPGADAMTLQGLPARWAEFIAAPGATSPRARTLEGWRVAPLGVSGGESGWLLHRADAIQEPEELSSTLAHDLRAPIRVVEGFTRIVKEDHGRALDRVAMDHLDRVLAATARMNLMIDALLTMSRLSAQPLSRVPVDLSHLASQVVDDLRRLAPEREVSVSIEPGLAAAGDPTLLRLVLENLLGNAWKYTARARAARISMSGARHRGVRAFTVADNGAGFDMRSAERLFGLFQRLHSTGDFPGHGVGLASVRRIVRRHGGEVWGEAEPGRGARFTFTLP
jgi:signal transduction histidine kinase